MTSTGAHDDRSFKVRDAGSYDQVAQLYDRRSDRFTGPMVERLLTLAQPKDSERMLDVGTGMGIVAREAARASGPSMEIVGVDLSDGMLGVAIARATDQGLAQRVTFRRTDAEALSLDDCSFDVVMSLFALAHFPDPGSALREMYRVLRPGGRVVVGIGSGPALFSRDGLAQGLRRLSDVVEQLRGRRLMARSFLNALTEKHHQGVPAPEEAHWFGDNPYLPRVVPGLLRDAGLDAVRTVWQGQRARISDAEEFWQLQITFSSIARKRIAAAPPDVADQIKEEFMRTCHRVQSRGGTLLYPRLEDLVVPEDLPVHRLRRSSSSELVCIHRTFAPTSYVPFRTSRSHSVCARALRTTTSTSSSIAASGPACTESGPRRNSSTAVGLP